MADKLTATENGVKRTSGSLRNPNLKSQGGAEFFPIIDETVGLTTTDGNDGKHNGTQDSFSMPAFANGTDKRHRG